MATGIAWPVVKRAGRFAYLYWDDLNASYDVMSAAETQHSMGFRNPAMLNFMPH
jgi:hypothetical protein